MIDGIDIYFKIGKFTYQQNFKDIFSALSFIKELENYSLKDGGTTEEGLLIGCRENKMYGINIWENFSQTRISKSELEELVKENKAYTDST